MRTLLTFAAAAGLLAFTACGSKTAGESPAPVSMEDAANATDIAETTASPIDTQGMLADTLAATTAAGDSLK